MTLSNTKGVDIIVSDQRLEKLCKLEVKTTTKLPSRERLFGNEKSFTWVMSSKHEKINEKSLYYCFVALQNETTLPKFFIVPSSYVAWYVKWQHKKFLKSRKRKGAATNIRRFRIPITDPKKFENAWNKLS